MICLNDDPYMLLVKGQLVCLRLLCNAIVVSLNDDPYVLFVKGHQLNM